MRPHSVMFRTLLALLLGLAAAHLPGCSRPAKFEFTRLCMGVQTRVTVHAPSMDSAAAAAALAFDRIATAEQALSDYRPASEAMRLCDLADERAGEWLPIRGDLRQALRTAQRLAAATDGAFCVTIGPAVRLWRESRRTGQLPAEADRLDAVARSDWTKLELDPTGCSARFHARGMRLDFGGIGKGYAAQRALEELTRNGHPRSMFALAGDIAMGDPPPGTDGWRIRVHENLPDLLLRNIAVSTSGDAEQVVEIAGVKYSHIVDVTTGLGFPAPRGVLVTVIAADGAIADALGTALYALPLEHAPALLAEFHAAAILIIGDPCRDPEVRIIDPHRLLRWAE